MTTLELKDGYDKKKSPSVLTFRTVTPREVRDGDMWRESLWFETSTRGKLDGFAKRVRANGGPKTWKTRPDVELPVKYGLRECARAVSRGDEMVLPSGGRLLVLISE